MSILTTGDTGELHGALRTVRAKIPQVWVGVQANRQSREQLQRQELRYIHPGALPQPCTSRAEAATMKSVLLRFCCWHQRGGQHRHVPPTGEVRLLVYIHVAPAPGAGARARAQESSEAARAHHSVAQLNHNVIHGIRAQSSSTEEEARMEDDSDIKIQYRDSAGRSS